MSKEFDRYARSEFGVSSMTMHRYRSFYDAYINPTIIEERMWLLWMYSAVL